jgi:hypothetical protein
LFLGTQRAGVRFHATENAFPASKEVHRDVAEEPMWNRRDWDDFFRILKKRGPKHLPLRPLDRSRPNRLVPADGYSLAELDDVGLSIEQAENLGLPVDAGRVGSYSPNVSELREFIRASRARF